MSAIMLTVVHFSDEHRITTKPAQHTLATTQWHMKDIPKMPNENLEYKATQKSLKTNV